MSVKVKLDNPKKIMNRILNDKVGVFTAETWAKYFSRYTPKESGMLGQTYTTEPYKVTYTSIYAHFQHEGKVMVDDRGSTWAKLRQSKHYIDRKLTYSKEKNPQATDHWEELAKKNHKREVAQEITAFIKRS